MGQGSLFMRALHEHRDRRPNALIDEHHENRPRCQGKPRSPRSPRQRRGPALQQRVYSYVTVSLKNRYAPIIPVMGLKYAPFGSSKQRWTRRHRRPRQYLENHRDRSTDCGHTMRRYFLLKWPGGF
jgi:hypothetical protein